MIILILCRSFTGHTEEAITPFIYGLVKKKSLKSKVFDFWSFHFLYFVNYVFITCSLFYAYPNLTINEKRKS